MVAPVTNLFEIDKAIGQLFTSSNLQRIRSLRELFVGNSISGRQRALSAFHRSGASTLHRHSGLPAWMALR